MNSSKSLSTRTVVTIGVVAALLLVGGFIIAQLTPSLFPAQASAEAVQVDDLFKLMMFIGGAIFLLVQLALVYSAWRFRARPGDMSDGPPLHGNTTLETVWTAFPAVIVLVLTILSYQVWTTNRSEKPDEQIVQATGARFAWQFAYQVPVTPLPDDVVLTDLSASLQEDIADDGIITINSNFLHTYVGRPVHVQMQSRDVIHAFWIPAMRIKQDVIPGRTTEVRFTPILVEGEEYPATYPVVCAELCGGGHGQMRVPDGVMVHETAEDYNNWLAAEVQARLYPPDFPPLRGQQTLASGIYNCNGCHHLDEFDTWTGVTGPNLEGVGERAATTRSTATGLSAYEYLQQSIHAPGAFLVPGFGNLMIVAPPPSEQDISDIAAFLCYQTATGESACEEFTEPLTE
jgi:cytochrome c oxidase subunit II